LRLEAAYREKEDLIMVGAYQRGSDPYVDAAIAYRERSLQFLRQLPEEMTAYGDTFTELNKIADAIENSVGRRAA
jgi:flagellar biosynthesis/type III secretory pathway ATPase